MDKDADATMRFNANRELLQYLEPKLKAIELTGKDGEKLLPDVIKIVNE